MSTSPYEPTDAMKALLSEAITRMYPNAAKIDRDVTYTKDRGVISASVTFLDPNWKVDPLFRYRPAKSGADKPSWYMERDALD